MTYRFLVRMDVPDDWKGEAVMGGHYETARQLAEQLREACERITPSPECNASIAWNPPAEPPRPDAGGELERREPAGILERPDQITIDARHQQQVNIHESPESRRTRAAMCGDCGEKYELTGDPTENHRRAMLHKEVCPRRAESEAERGRLIQEFQAQPMQVRFREQAAAALAAGVDPALLAKTGVPVFGEIQRPALPSAPDPELYKGTVSDLFQPAPRRWWQFWRWFE